MAKSPLTVLDTVLTHPEPFGVVLVIGPQATTHLHSTELSRSVELPPAADPGPSHPGPGCRQLCHHQTQVRVPGLAIWPCLALPDNVLNLFL